MSINFPIGVCVFLVTTPDKSYIRGESNNEMGRDGAAADEVAGSSTPSNSIRFPYSASMSPKVMVFQSFGSE